jgi:hypothetical protein
MEKPKLFLAITLLCCGSISSFAERIFPQTAKQTTSLKKVKSGNRPMAPATFSLMCEYMPGYFKLEFTGGVDNLYVKLIKTDNQTIWDGYFSISFPSSGIPELTGEYNIICVDEYENEFVGTLDFE